MLGQLTALASRLAPTRGFACGLCQLERLHVVYNKYVSCTQLADMLAYMLAYILMLSPSPIHTHSLAEAQVQSQSKQVY